jgi:Ca2+-binding EF-hand superfamily protein
LARHAWGVRESEHTPPVTFFSKSYLGTLKEKLKLIFEMCDRNRDKVVQKDEFCALVKSLNMAVGVKIDQRLQDNVVDTVLYRAGIDASQKTLTYEDFEAIFTTTTDSIRRPLGVHLRGASLKVNLEE